VSRVRATAVVLLGLSACVGQIDSPRALPGPTPQGPPAPQARVRTVRRLSGDQVRAALRQLTQATYTGPASVRDPQSPQGVTQRPDADLLDVLGASLGRPDYNYVVHETLQPGITFSKLVEDAARSTCGQAAQQPSSLLFIKASSADALPEAEPAIRANIAALVLRFWGESVEPSDARVSALLQLFGVAASAPAFVDRDGNTHPQGSPRDGWRIVCVALATDPQFYVY
jgi:hypothetical protein